MHSRKLASSDPKRSPKNFRLQTHIENIVCVKIFSIPRPLLNTKVYPTSPHTSNRNISFKCKYLLIESFLYGNSLVYLQSHKIKESLSNNLITTRRQKLRTSITISPLYAIRTNMPQFLFSPMTDIR